MQQNSDKSILDQAKYFINALSTPGQTNEANAWLMDFATSTAAWAVADNLIREPKGSPYRFFGSITMYNKIQRDLFQLDSVSVQSLTQGLVQVLISRAQEKPLDMTVCRYICLSVAAISVQLNQDGVVSQILQWLNAIMTSAPIVVLELLTVLPEECYNKKIYLAPDKRDIFAQQLSQTVGDVFAFLDFVRTSQQSIAPDVDEQIFKCIERWVDTTNFPPSILSQHPVLPFLLSGLAKDGDAFERAVDAVISILRRFRTDDTNIVNAIFPLVLAQRVVFDKLVSQFASSLRCDIEAMENELNTCRTITRLVTETAEAFIDVVTSNPDEGLLMLLAFLIECARFPFDYSIARIPLKFFDDLCTTVREQNNIGLISGENRARLASVYLALLDVCVQQLILSDVLISGDHELAVAQTDQRLEFRDSVGDCCGIAGADQCLEKLCGLLQAQLTAGPDGAANIAAVEAVLYALQKVIALLKNSKNNALVAQILSFLFTLPNIPLLTRTAIELMGKSAHCIVEDVAVLSSILQTLGGHLKSTSTCSQAAIAILDVLRAVSDNQKIMPELVPAAQNVYELMIGLRRANSLPLESDIKLIEGFCYAITCFPVPMRSPTFIALVSPVINSLSGLLALSGATVGAINADIDRLINAFRFIDIDKSVVLEVFGTAFPLLQQALKRGANNSNSHGDGSSTASVAESTCERVCRCYKFVMRSTKLVFLPHLTMMTAHVAESFQTTPVSAFIYAASICLSTFSHACDASQLEALYKMIWSISETFFLRMPDLESYERSPDLVEEYFYLLAKALECCPGPLVLSPSASVLVQAGITGLQLRHREAQKGILLFFEELVELPARKERGLAEKDGPRPGDSSVEIGASKPSAVAVASMASGEYASASRALIKQSGHALVVSILLALAGDMPAYCIDESDGSLFDVMWILRELSMNDLLMWVEQAIPNLNSNAQECARAMGLTQALLSCRYKSEYCAVLDSFEYRCSSRRRK